MTASDGPFANYIPLAEKACRYLSVATDPYYAVKHAISTLEKVGFTRLSLRRSTSSASSSLPFSSLQNGGKYYYTVEHSTLVAFIVGTNYQPGKSGFHIIGGHTDR
jgi:aspartyl aminopeptidase